MTTGQVISGSRPVSSLMIGFGLNVIGFLANSVYFLKHETDSNIVIPALIIF